ncbi:MAG TPA: cytochrome-c peroxidase [Bacteroidetes bacterium]|nr:cytochrome-c peroxidase [Bacteroidota bacterium]
MKKYTLLAALCLVSLLFIQAGINLNQPDNYAAQTVPNYINQDNTPPFNMLGDKGATLGRVLFYDKNLSLTGTVACASCHKQEFGFGDTAQLSDGHTGGKTGRHSMRLINSRFAQEVRFFWDERATSLEDQTTRPIQDHIEMGYSGSNGDPDLDSLMKKMATLPYYPALFTYVFGDATITETRMQQALAQFVRSIQSFDSKYDAGRAQVNTDADFFPNFSTAENAGKAIFLAPPNQGGAGCQGCHRAPEFDIAPNTQNNGVIHVAGTVDDVDLTNTRSPSLRDLFNPQGQLNGPLMHNGEFSTIEEVIEHYNSVPNDVRNTNLDPRLRGPGGVGTQQLNLGPNQKAFLAAFLKTLSGNNVYTDPKWSDPFEPDGSLNLSLVGLDKFETAKTPATQVYPNPFSQNLNIHNEAGIRSYRLLNMDGKLIQESTLAVSMDQTIFCTNLRPGIYWLILELGDGRKETIKILNAELLR